MISEYDAFGPWVYEIDEEHPVPSLFAAYIKETEQPLIQLKIPREIARRDANPDMNLYDYVLGLYTDHISVLKRENNVIHPIQADYKDIEALRLYKHLLAGILILYLPGGKLEIPFNTVSLDIMKRFTRLIREHYQENTSKSLKKLALPNNLDPLSSNLINDLQDEGDQPLSCVYQPVAGKVDGFIGRFCHPSVLACLHLQLPEELLIIQQEPTMSSDKGYIYHHTYISLSKIEKISFTTDEKSACCLIHLPHHEISYAFEENNQSIRSFYDTIQKSLALHH